MAHVLGQCGPVTAPVAYISSAPGGLKLALPYYDCVTKQTETQHMRWFPAKNSESFNLS